MTTVHFVRHAVHPLVDRVLVGRTDLARLDAAGREQARALGERLRAQGVSAVQSSPRSRAVETAELIAAPLGLQIEILPDLDEADFGAWAGLSFTELSRDPRWGAWNNARGSTRPPGGETMQEIAARILEHLQRLFRERPDDRIVLVSHAEVIRAALLHLLGMPHDDFAAVDVSPASISTVLLDCSGARVMAINER